MTLKSQLRDLIESMKNDGESCREAKGVPDNKRAGLIEAWRMDTSILDVYERFMNPVDNDAELALQKVTGEIAWNAGGQESFKGPQLIRDYWWRQIEVFVNRAIDEVQEDLATERKYERVCDES